MGPTAAVLRDISSEITEQWWMPRVGHDSGPTCAIPAYMQNDMARCEIRRGHCR